MGALEEAKKFELEKNYKKAANSYQKLIDGQFVTDKISKQAKEGLQNILDNPGISGAELMAIGDKYWHDYWHDHYDYDYGYVKWRDTLRDAKPWYLKAIQRKYIPAYLTLAKLYEKNELFDEAVKYYQKVIDSDVADEQQKKQAEQRIYHHFRHPTFSFRNYDLSWFEIQIRRINNWKDWFQNHYSDSQVYSIAKMYYEGIEVKKNYVWAVAWAQHVTNTLWHRPTPKVVVDVINSPDITMHELEQIADFYIARLPDNFIFSAYAFMNCVEVDRYDKSLRNKCSNALLCYEKLRDKGSVTACLTLAKYYDGSITKHHAWDDSSYIKNAIIHYQLAIDRGYEQAQQDIDRIVNQLIEASIWGAPRLNVLADLYQQGIEVKQNLAKAKYLREKAQELQRNQEYDLAKYYEERKQHPDFPLAVICYQTAADLGHPEASHNINRLLNHPDISANDLHAIAINYHHGNKAPKNIPRAKQFYEKALAKGHAPAGLALAVIHEEADEAKEAIGCYRAVVKLNNSPEIHQKIGNIYENGSRRMVIDKMEAAKCYLRAIKAGASLTELEQTLTRLNLEHDKWYQMGLEYYYGLEPPIDYTSARICFEQVVRIEPQSSCNLQLAIIYEEGREVPIDFVKARNYYEKCQNNPRMNASEVRKNLRAVNKKIIEQKLDNGEPLSPTMPVRAARDGNVGLLATLMYLGVNTKVRDDLLSRTKKNQTTAVLSRLIAKKPGSDLAKSAAEIIVGNIHFYGMSDEKEKQEKRASIQATLESWYKLSELKPLLDLTKLAVLGKHNKPVLSMDDNDSGDEEEISDSQKLSVIMDLKNKPVSNIVCGDNYDNTLGVCIPDIPNKIFVAGLEDKQSFPKGTLIHELTHYIAKEVYENDYLPYKVDDDTNKAKFSRISQDMERRRATLLPVFKNVFSLYPVSQYHIELIVRVAEFIVENEAGVETLKREEPQLFDYYQNVFLPDVKQHAEKLHKRALHGWSPNFSLFKFSGNKSRQEQKATPGMPLTNSP